MAISKTGKMYCTKEQIDMVKRERNNALAYAKAAGYDLIPHGSGRYIMREHDSMVFLENGFWFWNSQNLHGKAIDFIMQYEGKSLAEAVLLLAGDCNLSQPIERQLDTSPAAIPSTKSFHMPDKAPNYRRLYFYLCQVRGLDKSVVDEMVRQGKVYQSRHVYSGGYADNACFIYHDNNKKAVGAFLRGMREPQPGQPLYKRDVPGTDKQWGWLLEAPNGHANRVQVFEGAIDAASGATISALKCRDLKKFSVDRLSLEGCSNHMPLENYLKSHPDVREIDLLLDNDPAGRLAADTIEATYKAKGYLVRNFIPKLKDINEELLQLRSREKECDLNV